MTFLSPSDGVFPHLFLPPSFSPLVGGSGTLGGVTLLEGGVTFPEAGSEEGGMNGCWTDLGPGKMGWLLNGAEIGVAGLEPELLDLGAEVILEPLEPESVLAGVVGLELDPAALGGLKPVGAEVDVSILDSLGVGGALSALSPPKDSFRFIQALSVSVTFLYFALPEEDGTGLATEFRGALTCTVFEIPCC